MMPFALEARMDKYQTEVHCTHKRKDKSANKRFRLGGVKPQTDGYPTLGIPPSACAGMMMAARHAAASEAAFAFHAPHLHTIR